MWKYDSQTNAWQMIDPNSPATIRIPDGMSAGYISNQSMQFSSVMGPVTIYNVNFIAIMCD
jgi:hypothetical protein